MRKKILYLLSVVLASSILSANVVCAHAADVEEANEWDNVSNIVAPCYESGNMCNCGFDISDSGRACTTVLYSANSDNFSQAKLTVKIQKKVLGLLWKTIDVDGDSDQWVVYLNSASDFLSFYVELEDTGTYRAVISLEITTTSGSVDEMEETIECKYK